MRREKPFFYCLTSANIIHFHDGTMSMTWQPKAFAILCIVAGLARAFFSFVPWQNDRVDLEIIALLIDLGTLFGLCAFYFPQSQKLGILGFVGFILTASGLAIITGVDGQAFGIDVYSAGTLIIGCGLLVFSAALLLAKLAPRAAALWLAMIATQAVFTSIAMADLGFVLVGILYGLGFVALGWSSLQKVPERAS